MKKSFLAWLALGLATLLPAQTTTAVYPTEYTPEQLDQLTAPIALYPDALVALILPAATAPSDIVLADRYLLGNGDPAQIPNQPWDDSVKALANYPQVIEWMSDNLEWTTALGRAFLEQPAQVMESIQQLRAQARTNGALTSTPQQNVVVDGSTILIQPASDNVLYIPEYDPDIVFAESPTYFTTPVIYFSSPCPVGAWLAYECDWDDYGVWVGAWHPGWTYARPWRQPGPAGRFWRPDNVRQREMQRWVNRPIEPPPRPQLMRGTPPNAQRPPPGFHPGQPRPPARPDPTGWHDANGNLARPQQTNGPQVVQATPGAPLTPTPLQVQPFHPQPITGQPLQPQPLHPQPITGQPIPSQPVTGQPAQPQPIKTQPLQTQPITSQPLRPQPLVNRPAPAAPMQRQELTPTAPAQTGPLFGGYSRGTDARDFSNRGQASLATSRPPAPRPPPARSMPPGAPLPPGNQSGQRAH